MLKFATKSLVKSFNEKLGGKWTYNRKIYEWSCDDGVRYIHNVLTGKDMEGEYTGESSLCLYYRDHSKSPEWIFI